MLGSSEYAAGRSLADRIIWLRNSVSRFNGLCRPLCCSGGRAVHGRKFCPKKFLKLNMVARDESVAGRSNRLLKWSDFAKSRASRATGRSWRARKNVPRAQPGWNAVEHRSRACGDASSRALAQRSSTNERFGGISRPVSRAPTRPLAIRIGWQCLRAYFRHV